MSRIKELEAELKKHQDLYYNKCETLLSDREYDKLEEELRKLDPTNSMLDKIGASTWEGFEKVEHPFIMGSQAKVTTEEDFIAWWNKNNIKKAYVEDKLDGISIRIEYVKGELTKAVTRGNGKVGDDITKNVLKMKYVQKNIDTNYTGSIRGEIVMSRSVFNAKYKDDHANPRNLASGISKGKHGKNCEDLQVLVYDAIPADPSLFSTETEKLTWLYQNNIQCVRVFAVSSSQEAIATRNLIDRSTLDIAIDGLVVKNDIVDFEDMKRNKPNNQIAFKWSGDQEETTVVDIVWSRNGFNYTPKAIVEPVELNGTTVKQASLANYGRVKGLDIHVGDTVIVSKRGDIIPYVEKVITPAATPKPRKMPTVCEVCGEDLTITDTSIQCTNLTCQSRSYHRLQKYTDKLQVKGFGEALCQDLSNKGYTSINGLYNQSDIEGYLASSRLKKASKKAFDNLWAIKEISLAKFVSGFDIEGIGEGVVEFAVKAGYDTLEALRAVTVEQLSKVEGFSTIRAEQFVEGMLMHSEDMNKTARFLSLAGSEKHRKRALDGMSFCVTGKLKHTSRKEIEELIKENGGTIKSVSKGLSYLINNDISSTSGKNKKAKDLGINIIKENDFYNILGMRRGI